MNIDTGTLLSFSAAGAGTYSTVDLPNGEWSKISVGINFTTVTSATVVVTVYGKDIVSGTYYALLAGPGLTTTGFTNLQIAPGLTPTSTSADGLLPKTYRITAVVTGGSAVVTGTIGASLLQ